MKYSKLMRERIHRTQILFRELGYEIVDPEESEGAFTASFHKNEEYEGNFFIDEESKFLEVAFTFIYSNTLQEYLRSKIEDIFRICYEYGCYINFQFLKHEVSMSIFSKIYFAGLNYYALKETLRDFRAAVFGIRELTEIKSENKKGETHGDS
ncbi:MAG TPA: hypothetical protein PLG79_04805 [Spirochaetales bacterium]|nr:hypothetical protein [Spirochaetales bacterium]